MTDHFRVNEPDVTYESFDTEVLAINLRNGNYYSLRESAVPIWQLAVRGLSVGEIGAALAQSASGDAAEVTAAVRVFLAELEAEALLVAQSAPAAHVNGKPPVTLPATFAKPVLDRYTDMQQLLLMDPIHETDVTGWPAKAPPNHQD